MIGAMRSSRELTVNHEYIIWFRVNTRSFSDKTCDRAGCIVVVMMNDVVEEEEELPRLEGKGRSRDRRPLF